MPAWGYSEYAQGCPPRHARAHAEEVYSQALRPVPGGAQVVPRRHDEARLVRAQDGPCRWCRSKGTPRRGAHPGPGGAHSAAAEGSRLPMHPAPGANEAALSRFAIARRWAGVSPCRQARGLDGTAPSPGAVHTYPPRHGAGGGQGGRGTSSVLTALSFDGAPPTRLRCTVGGGFIMGWWWWWGGGGDRAASEELSLSLVKRMHIIILGQ